MLPLIKLIGIMYLGCLIHVIITYLPCIRYAGLKPGTFFRGLSAPLLTSFTTCSSAAALSTNLTCVQKLGASRSVSSFSIPLGNTINMDGTAIYMGIVTIFAAEIYGMPLPLDQQISVLLIALLASVGTMGVPGAALIMLSMIFTHVGIPLEAIALVAGIDRVMDMARTTINVLGDATAAIFISRTENDFDPQRGAALPGRISPVTAQGRFGKRQAPCHAGPLSRISLFRQRSFPARAQTAAGGLRLVPRSVSLPFPAPPGGDFLYPLRRPWGQPRRSSALSDRP